MVKDVTSSSEATTTLACNALSVSRSGYYSWLDRPVSAREITNTKLIERIRVIHANSDETYGSPRVTEVLRAEGLGCGENRVAKLMRENNIVSAAVKKFKITTTDSKHELPIAERVFETEKASGITSPNQVWTGDITYIATEEGWLFLAVFLDLFTRKIVGFSCDDHMRTELVLNALTMALGRQEVKDGELVTHTDRGSQYAANEYRKKLQLAGIIASMSRKGNCYDNAHVESFFHSLKTELVYRRNFRTRKEATQAIFEWIETWYNRKRLHSSLGYKSPQDYENMALAS